MQDDPLIDLLRRSRGEAPEAPKDEWFRVAGRTLGAPRPRAWAWGLGVGVAAAGLWLVLAGPPRPAPLKPVATLSAAASRQELRRDLEPLEAAMEVPADDPARTPGHEMLRLLNAV